MPQDIESLKGMNTAIRAPEAAKKVQMNQANVPRAITASVSSKANTAVPGS